MTKQEKIEAYSMRLDGYSLQQIADRFGISRQRVQQILPGGGGIHRRRSAIVFPNIEKYLRDNSMTTLRFASLCNLSNGGLSNILNGKINPSKKTIDAILEATGMTYEFAFAKGEKTDSEG